MIYFSMQLAIKIINYLYFSEIIFQQYITVCIY
jgi:hypothetical protein